MTTDGFGMRDEDFAAAVVAQAGRAERCYRRVLHRGAHQPGLRRGRRGRDAAVTTHTHRFDGGARVVVRAAVRQALADLLVDLAPPASLHGDLTC